MCFDVLCDLIWRPNSELCPLTTQCYCVVCEHSSTVSSCNTVTLLKNMQHLHHFPEFTQKICCFYDTSLIPHEPDLLPILRSTFSLQTYSSLTTIFCSLLSYSKYDPSFYLLFIVNKSSHLHPQHCFISIHGTSHCECHFKNCSDALHFKKWTVSIS